MQPLRVFVALPELALCRLLATALVRVGLDVSVAHDWPCLERAVAGLKLDELEPDGLVVSAELPGSGTGWARRLRDAAPYAAIFVVVALGDREAWGRLADNEATVVELPFDVLELREEVLRACRAARARGRPASAP